MKQLFSENNFLGGFQRRLGLGLLTALTVSTIATAQTASTVVSSLTDNGITTTTYSSGQVVKTVADGYFLDSAFYKNNNVKRATSAKRYWKLTDRVGIAIPFCTTEEDNTMFLKPGAYNSLSINHFWGMFGLGLMGGYQNFGVKDAYNGAGSIIAKNAAALAPGKPLKYDNVGSYEDFYLLVGPAISVPVGKKFSIDADLKGGLFNTSAPRFGATVAGTDGADQLIYRLTPSASRNQLGGVLSVDLLYKIAKTWSVGINGQGFLTSTPFTTMGQSTAPGSTLILTKEGTRSHGGCNFGLALSHTFGENYGKNTVYSLLPPPPAPVICYTPTIQGENGKMFDYGSSEKPCFKWKSTSTSAQDEDYIFKLYKADGTGTPVYSQTTKNQNLCLPANVALVNNDECSFYYYTVQSSVEGKCLSEATAASFGYRAKPVVAIAATKPVEDQYMFKIFGGSTATKYFGDGVAKPRRKARKAVVKSTTTETSAAPVVAKKIVPRKKKKSSGGVTTSKTVVNYENVATNPTIVWPKDLPLPKSPAVYEYEVQRLNAGDCKPTGTVAKYKFYIDPKNPSDIRIIPDKKK